MRKLTGVIVGDKMTKTRVVLISRLKKHPKYLRYYKVSKKFKAHDEKEEYKTGDTVVIEETKPLSKEKRWKIIGKISNVQLPISNKMPNLEIGNW